MGECATVPVIRCFVLSLLARVAFPKTDQTRTTRPTIFQQELLVDFLLYSFFHYHSVILSEYSHSKEELQSANRCSKVSREIVQVELA